MRIEPDGKRTRRLTGSRCSSGRRSGQLVGLPNGRAILAAAHGRGAPAVADVPVRCLLSGGLDSSLIVGLLAEAGQHGLATFSIGFEAAGGEEGDEFKYSDVIAREYDTDITRSGSTPPACCLRSRVRSGR